MKSMNTIPHKLRKTGAAEDAKKQRQQRAISLLEEHNKLTIQQKIEKAKSRRGESKKEIARLEKMLQE